MVFNPKIHAVFHHQLCGFVYDRSIQLNQAVDAGCTVLNVIKREEDSTVSCINCGGSVELQDELKNCVVLISLDNIQIPTLNGDLTNIILAYPDELELV